MSEQEGEKELRDEGGEIDVCLFLSVASAALIDLDCHRPTTGQLGLLLF